MPEPTTPTRYDCPKCGYTNLWTRDEVLQRGKEEIYRGDDETIYSLRCKNPLGCDQRVRVAVKR
jgi:predicted nucleic-acid-binding Zn-ribbon protein